MKARFQIIIQISLWAFASLLNFDAVKTEAETYAGQVKAIQGYGQLPLRFELNAGQADAQVRYISRGNGYAMYFMPTEVALALYISPNPVPSRHHPATNLSTNFRGGQFGLVHIKLAEANTNPVISSEQDLPEKINYLIGNDESKWRRNISAFGRVSYQNIYPGINLTFYGNQSQLEYDFLVAPEVDPQKIKIILTGAEKVEIETNGNLALTVQGHTAHFHCPVVFQNIAGIRHDIASSYYLHGNTVGFKVGTYDRSHLLVIDPVLSYSTFLGGSGLDGAQDVATDSSGNAYICGYTTATFNVPASLGAFETNNIGGKYPYGCYVAKVSSSGTNLVYLTYLGGSSFDIAYGIAVNTNGNAYITGYTSSTDFPVTNALFPIITSYNFGSGLKAVNGSGYGDAIFLTEFNTNGSQLVFSTYYGPTNGNSGADNWGAAVAVDSQNNIYFAGTTEAFGSGFPVVHAVQSVPLRPSGTDYRRLLP